MSLTEHKDGSITLDDARKTVCLESAWELDALGRLRCKLEGDGSQTDFQVRALAIRISALSGVLVLALCDTGSDAADLMKTVCPKKP